MIASLQRRERVIVGAGVVVLALVLVWRFVVDPIVERQRLATELVPARQQALARRLDLLARRSRVASELEAVGARLDRVSARLLTSAAPAVAASELQKLAKDMASQARTEIRSERILTPVDRGELLEVPIEVTVAAEIRQLVDLLARLEGSQKLLTVQDLRVRVVNLSQPRELLATVTVSGFILPSKTKT